MGSFSLKKENINNLIEISKSAGQAIMDIYKTDFDIKLKKDRSPLTRADISSHIIISEALLKMTPDIPIISEESSNISFDKRSKWELYWLIDPLDGTKEFINKNGEFTTNIALIYKNRPILGVIHAPARNETYWGNETQGSYFQEGGSNSDIRKINISENPQSNLRIVASSITPK